MDDINIVTLVGRLTKDAEVKALPSGAEVAEMSIASNYSVKKGDQWVDEVSYFDVVKFKPGGLAQYLKKGKQISVVGELQQQRWEKDGQKRSRVKIMARKLQLLGGKETQSAYGQEPGDLEHKADPGFEDDVPF